MRKRYYASKHKFPTTIIKGSKSGGKGGVSLGWKKAKRYIESKFDRQLRGEVKVETKGNNWRFTETY